MVGAIIHSCIEEKIHNSQHNVNIGMKVICKVVDYM